MSNRRDVLKGLGIGAALPELAPGASANPVPGQAPAERVRHVLVTRVRIGLAGAHQSFHPDDEVQYWAETFEDRGKHYSRAKAVTIETTVTCWRSSSRPVVVPH